METVTLSVPTVHCQSCKLNIEESLEEVDGVSSSNVDLDAKTVTVTFDPTDVDADFVAALIAAAGYPTSA
jgi:copper chaperone CopZ